MRLRRVVEVVFLLALVSVSVVLAARLVTDDDDGEVAADPALCPLLERYAERYLDGSRAEVVVGGEDPMVTMLREVAAAAGEGSQVARLADEMRSALAAEDFERFDRLGAERGRAEAEACPGFVAPGPLSMPSIRFEVGLAADGRCTLIGVTVSFGRGEVQRGLPNRLGCDAKDLAVITDDYDFDGDLDLAIVMFLPTSNFPRYEFWLQDDRWQLQPSTEMNDAALFGLEVDADREVLRSTAKDGSSRAVHQEFEWQGGQLVELSCSVEELGNGTSTTEPC